MTVKLARICWNTEGWMNPSGDAAELENDKAFVTEYGFGHEEWLFNFSWLIGGYHYAFLQQPLRAKKKHIGRTYDVVLYSINEQSQRVIVGRINNCRCLTTAEACNAVGRYQKRGWLKQMSRDVAEVEGDDSSIDDAIENKSYREILNIRFRPEDVAIHTPHRVVDPSKIRATRYYFYDLAANGTAAAQNSQWFGQTLVPHHGTRDLRPTKATHRSDYDASEIDFVHNRLQNRLFMLLDARYGEAVRMEVDGIDIQVRHPDLNAIFEVKKAADARLAVREALGQILEYALFKDPSRKDLPRLFVVSPAPPTQDLTRYLSELKSRFGLTIEYLQLHLSTKQLGF